jgi:hypothetical protein
MVDRKCPSIIAAYKQAFSLFESRRFKPLLQQLDNEASNRNAAERAIHTFKNHFIPGLCSTNRDFPLNM